MTRPADLCSADEAAPALGVWVRRDAVNDVWFVERSEIPGLNAEAPSFDALVDIIRDLAPDLVAAGDPVGASGMLPEVAFCVHHLVNAHGAHAA